MHALHNLITFGYKFVVVKDLFLQCILEFLNVLEISRISCLKSHKLTR